jgi:predicted AlkP superfamily pyrophosphatase or phosphodiesterase
MNVKVYGEHLDNVGHEFGPDSEELKQAIRDIDDVIYDFLDRMTDTGLDEKVKFVSFVKEHKTCIRYDALFFNHKCKFQ